MRAFPSPAWPSRRGARVGYPSSTLEGMRVDVAWLPPAQASGDRTCVVIDVLRATSSIATLLARGVEAIYPVATIEEGLALRGQLGSGALLCGERNALPPPGFDFGNSPSEFAAADLTRWTAAVMATTNGTPALLACAGAPLVLAAAPLNAQATVEACLAAGHDVLVVCSGRAGVRATDDSLAAALIVKSLVAQGAIPDPQASEALALLEAVPGSLASAFRLTEHGRALVTLGFEQDLECCARESVYPITAVLGKEDGHPVLRGRPR